MHRRRALVATLLRAAQPAAVAGAKGGVAAACGLLAALGGAAPPAAVRRTELAVLGCPRPSHAAALALLVDMEAALAAAVATAQQRTARGGRARAVGHTAPAAATMRLTEWRAACAPSLAAAGLHASHQAGLPRPAAVLPRLLALLLHGEPGAVRGWHAPAWVHAACVRRGGLGVVLGGGGSREGGGVKGG